MHRLNTKSVVCRGMAFRYTQTAIVLAALTACSNPTPPATQIKIQRETVEVMRACPETLPKRPAAIGALPGDLQKLAAVLGAKLMEWSGPGGYGERVEAAHGACRVR